MMSPVISIEKKNSVFFLHLRVVCGNSSKQSGWNYDSYYSFFEIEVFLTLGSVVCAKKFQDSNHKS